MRILKKGGKYEVVKASFGGIMGGGASRGGAVVQSTFSLLGGEVRGSMLDGLIQEKSPRQIQSVYKDIYLHDAIAGSAVDLKATMPWSDFTLEGCTEPQREVFEENLERLNVRNLLPELSTDQLVTGAFVGSLVYDKKLKGWKDVIPLNYADCIIRDVPLYSMEPMISLNVGPELKAFADDRSPEAVHIQEKIPQDMLMEFRRGKVADLYSKTTIYVPRTTMTSNQSGISYFRRLLPIFILERLLYRGTYSEASRRQRSLLHIQAGDEEWIPSEDELSSLVGLFQMTDMDPVSAIVATRNNVQTSEIRSGGDFWKWTDTIDQLANMKMRALGINETFLSGEGSYNTMETALTVFLADLDAYRNRTAYQIFGSKIFPTISFLHGFTKEDKSAETAGYLHKLDDELNDTANLVIPKINWHRELSPSFDQQAMDNLDKLTEKGWPVTLRMWAAASGQDFDAVDKQLAQDVKDRKMLAEWQARISEATGGAMGGINGQANADTQTEGSEFASLTPMQRLLTRDFKDDGLIFERSVTGKKKHVFRQKEANDRMNDMVMSAIKNLRDPNEFQLAHSRKRAWADTL